MLRRTLTGLVLSSLLLLASCGDGDDTTTSTPDEPAASSPSAASECDYPAGAAASKPVDPPTGEALSGSVAATMETNRGTLGLTLDADAAPCTVTSFASLAEQGYFDDTECHRLTTEGIFVLQCGDPTGTGTGGPGYSFGDELEGDEAYPAGTVAMANAGPDTNGSQFFIVYADTPLPPSYTVFGELDEEGLAAVEQVAEAGSDNANGPGDGAPQQAVQITSVTLD